MRTVLVYRFYLVWWRSTQEVVDRVWLGGRPSGLGGGGSTRCLDMHLLQSYASNLAMSLILYSGIFHP